MYSVVVCNIGCSLIYLLAVVCLKRAERIEKELYLVGWNKLVLEHTISWASFS